MYKQKLSNDWRSKHYKGQQSPESKANKIIKECIEQNEIFKKRQATQNWSAIHEAHYDWWAFPVNEPSSYGQQYMVFEAEVNIMRKSPKFMQALKSNAIIVCKAWGWDLIKGQEILTDHKDQRWHNWPIRLYKMTKSLEIFQLRPFFQHAVKYGIKIMTQSGKHLRYGQRDISAYFTSKWSEIRYNSNETKILSQKPTQTKPKVDRPQSLQPKGKIEKDLFTKKTNTFQPKQLCQEKSKDVQCQPLEQIKQIFRK